MKKFTQTFFECKMTRKYFWLIHVLFTDIHVASQTKKNLIKSSNRVETPIYKGIHANEV